MASLELRNGVYRVVFRHAGAKHGFSLGTGHRPTAEALRGGVEKTLLMLSQGLLDLPEDGDLVSFVRTGGRSAGPVRPAAEVVTFAKIRDAFLAARSNGVVEANSLATIRLHMKHLTRTFGERYAVAKVSLTDVQKHVDRRLAQKYRGRPVGPTTARKEVSAFRAMWNWGTACGLVSGPFPSKGLLYPKTDAKEPFATRRRPVLGGRGDCAPHTPLCGGRGAMRYVIPDFFPNHPSRTLRSTSGQRIPADRSEHSTA